MINDKVCFEEQVDEARYYDMSESFRRISGGNILKHIQVKAIWSDRLAVGRIRLIPRKANPITAAHRKPNWAINENTEVSLRT